MLTQHLILRWLPIASARPLLQAHSIHWRGTCRENNRKFGFRNPRYLQLLFLRMDTICILIVKARNLTFHSKRKVLSSATEFDLVHVAATNQKCRISLGTQKGNCLLSKHHRAFTLSHSKMIFVNAIFKHLAILNAEDRKSHENSVLSILSKMFCHWLVFEFSKLRQLCAGSAFLFWLTDFHQIDLSSKSFAQSWCHRIDSFCH